jgi:hypothetical protein
MQSVETDYKEREWVRDGFLLEAEGVCGAGTGACRLGGEG